MNSSTVASTPDGRRGAAAGSGFFFLFFFGTVFFGTGRMLASAGEKSRRGRSRTARTQAKPPFENGRRTLHGRPRMLDHLKLHAVVLAWGLTAILGQVIHLPALEIVSLRTALAVAGLAVVGRVLGVPLRLPVREMVALTGVGMLIGAHWMCFFAAGKASNASMTVAALPTTLIWTALFEWVLYGKRPLAVEFILGGVMFAAVWVIFRFEVDFSAGLWFSLASAVVGSLFAAINGQLARRHHYVPLSLYQMLGACLVSSVALPLLQTPVLPTLADVGWLLVLSLVCTVYAYTAYVELLRRVSVFTVNLVYNLEPVYTIVLGAVLLRDHAKLTPQFYQGTGLIIAAVIFYPFWKHRRGRPRTTAAA